MIRSIYATRTVIIACASSALRSALLASSQEVVRVVPIWTLIQARIIVEEVAKARTEVRIAGEALPILGTVAGRTCGVTGLTLTIHNELTWLTGGYTEGTSY